MTRSSGVHERTAKHSFALSVRQHSKAVLIGVQEWMRVALNHYRAAAAYEQLSRLSDTELCRRGLSRETLARDVVEAAVAHRFTENLPPLTEVGDRRP
jgi:hypothetical protein